jgi:hypothetical protein
MVGGISMGEVGICSLQTYVREAGISIK